MTNKHKCDNPSCFGVKLALLDDKTYCEYFSESERSFDCFHTATDHTTMDGYTIDTAVHPRPKFSFFSWLKGIFVRPKFSATALEPAKEVIISKTPLVNFGLPLQLTEESKGEVPLYTIEYDTTSPGLTEKDKELLKVLKKAVKEDIQRTLTQDVPVSAPPIPCEETGSHNYCDHLSNGFFRVNSIDNKDFAIFCNGCGVNGEILDIPTWRKSTIHHAETILREEDDFIYEYLPEQPMRD